ncbi:hypothetical protein V502_00372 [Pseudogymnoascus sp. VKM F-4520 (FW-2644)]|nr:hypothetical protein V502_00372 [Pseudogymnoascus sp. VKM F-4520 (FW-2644)]
MPLKSDEKNVILALQAMQNNPSLSARAAGKIYSVNHEKLCRRKLGIPSRCDIPANSRKLTDLEESVIVQHILDLAIKGFPLQMSVVEDMANRLLATRNAPLVGSRWASNFVKQRVELRTYATRHALGRSGLQNLSSGDPEVIHSWFELLRNTIAKYGIYEADIYNFDETGFMMGVISTAMVVTSSDGL